MLAKVIHTLYSTFYVWNFVKDKHNFVLIVHLLLGYKILCDFRLSLIDRIQNVSFRTLAKYENTRISEMQDKTHFSFQV